MALIVLASACGSPGVTTAALGLALYWPRPTLLVEADPTGGSGILAGYFRGDAPHPGGLIDLAVAHRAGTLAEALPAATMNLPGTTVQLLPGTRAHGQARSLVPLWEPLTTALQSLEGTGQDVIVDAGRLGLAGSPEPLIYGADLALLVTGSTLPALAGAKSWADTLREEFARTGAAANLGILLVGSGRPYGPREVSKVLATPVLSALAWDAPAAAVFSRGAKPPGSTGGSGPRFLRALVQALGISHSFQDSPLPRSLRATGSAIQAVLATNRASLGAIAGQGSQS